MPEIPKTDCEDEELSEKRDEASAWAEDQKKHEYYYDDAHGYEKFDPEKDENEDPGLSSPPG
jgi:hypothetical protein